MHGCVIEANILNLALDHIALYYVNGVMTTKKSGSSGFIRSYERTIIVMQPVAQNRERKFNRSNCATWK